jgi:serine protease Do
VGEKASIKLLRDGRTKDIKLVIEQLPEEGETATEAPKGPSVNRIGLSVSALDSKTHRELGRGVRVDQVSPGSVGHYAGLRPGDIILQIDRKNVENAEEFRKIVAKLPTGRMIPVLVHRQDADQFIVLKIPQSE